MATLLDIRDRVADILSRTDLNPQIETEIKLAITRYNRRVTWLHEVRNATLTTVVSQIWYPTIDISAGDAVQDVAARTAVSVQDVQRVDYMRTPDFDDMMRLDYFQFEELFDTSGTVGSPTYYTVYAGRIGIWPAPSDVGTYYLSVLVKPVVPVATTDESVWFDKAQDLIENAAAGAICRKFLSDGERAAAFQAYETEAWNEIVRESGLKRGSGKLTVHY